jgi:hypothetical protein
MLKIVRILRLRFRKLFFKIRGMKRNIYLIVDGAAAEFDLQNGERKAWIRRIAVIHRLMTNGARTRRGWTALWTRRGGQSRQVKCRSEPSWYSMTA